MITEWTRIPGCILAAATVLPVWGGRLYPHLVGFAAPPKVFERFPRLITAPLTSASESFCPARRKHSPRRYPRVYFEYAQGPLRRVPGIPADVSKGSHGEQIVEGPPTDIELKSTVLEDLWRRPRKHLMSIGKTGVKATHVRSLKELVKAHTLVKVKVNIPGCDLDSIGIQLCGMTTESGISSGKDDTEDATLESGKRDIGRMDNTEGPPTGVRMVAHRASQKMILFADAEFLSSLR